MFTPLLYVTFKRMHMQRIAKCPQGLKLCHNHYSLNYLYTSLIYLFIYLF